MDSGVDQDHNFKTLYDAAYLRFARNDPSIKKPNEKFIKPRFQIAKEALEDVSAPMLYREKTHILIALTIDK